MDVEEIHDVYADPAVWAQIDGVEVSNSLTETRRRVDRFIACQREHGFSFWAVREKQGGELIGDCGLIPRDWQGPEIELGYRLAPRQWGKGFAPEAASAWLAVGFDRLGLEQIIAVAGAEPHASRRVMDKIGMTYQATEGHDVIYAITR